MLHVQVVAACQLPHTLHICAAHPFAHDRVTCCRLAAQLARTEEAAKRALVRSDVSAKGGTAQALLDAQREVERLQEVNADLTNKLAR